MYKKPTDKKGEWGLTPLPYPTEPIQLAITQAQRERGGGQGIEWGTGLKQKNTTKGTKANDPPH